MNATNLPPAKKSHQWKILGETSIPVDENLDPSIQEKLAEILCPLPLPSELLEKVLTSAQEIAQQALQHNLGESRIKNIHLRVFVRSDHNSGLQTWGFFLIEKNRFAQKNEAESSYLMEYYLYPEQNA